MNQIPVPNRDETLNALLAPETLESALRADPSIRLLDVRTPSEFEAAHLFGAYNVPLDTLHEHAREIRAAVHAPLVLICQSGGRARKAEEALRIAGMSQLHVLDGGVSAWMLQHRPVVHGPKRMSLERQVRVVAGLLVALGSLVGLLVWPLAVLLPLAIGSGLVFSGLTDTCGMGLLLARLPYNRGAACDIAAVVRALTRTPT